MPKNNGKRRKAWRREFAEENSKFNKIHWDILDEVREEISRGSVDDFVRRWGFLGRVRAKLKEHPLWVDPEDRSPRPPKPDTREEAVWALQ